MADAPPAPPSASTAPAEPLLCEDCGKTASGRFDVTYYIVENGKVVTPLRVSTVTEGRALCGQSIYARRADGQGVEPSKSE